MRKLCFALVALVLGLNLVANEVIQKESKNSFDETIKVLEQQITSKGLGIFTKIEHQKTAEKVGLNMNGATVIIFGNPKVGSLLMQDNPAWSLELPLKIAVYEDSNKKVIVRARKLTTDIDTPNQSQKIDRINKLLSSLVNSN